MAGLTVHLSARNSSLGHADVSAETSGLLHRAGAHKQHVSECGISCNVLSSQGLRIDLPVMARHSWHAGRNARLREHLPTALDGQTPLVYGTARFSVVRPSCKHGRLRRSQRECRSKYGCRQSILERPVFGALWARKPSDQAAQVRARARVGLQV